MASIFEESPSFPHRPPQAHAAPGASGSEMGEKAWRELLDGAYQKLASGAPSERDVADQLSALALVLRACKGGDSESQWSACVELCREHPLTRLLHEDPFTRRAFEKPRGYPGDAELLDYIYGREEFWPAPEATPLGRKIFGYTTLAPAPEGVRARRGYVARLIDRVAERTRQPAVLSIAAGHLREAILTNSLKRKKLGRFVALDHDPLSLAEIERCYKRLGVETVHLGVQRLLANKLDIGRFDLVYSTGLFDYLGASVGRRLVTVMFHLLRPHGRLMVANFLPGIRDLGYMEVFMDWRLVYRGRRELLDLTMEIPQEEIQEISLFAEENQNIIFLEMVRM